MKKTIAIVAVALSLASCSMGRHISVDACPKWADNIKNPENEEFVEEVAFNLGIHADQVTQQQFNKRYEL